MQQLFVRFMSRALILIDFINEFLHPDGTIASQGMYEYSTQYHFVENTKRSIDFFRQNHEEIVWVHLLFHADYSNCSSISPRFKGMKDLWVLIEDTLSTTFLRELEHDPWEKTITKTRISPFYNTDLEKYLKEKGITEVVLTGVATDLAISSMAWDAHDRDFLVTVLADACWTVSRDHLESACIRLRKIAHVTDIDAFFHSTYDPLY